MATQTSNSKPVLWQLEIAHYSEKARWALAHKGIDHTRRTPLPGMHIPIALWLTRGAEKTVPIMKMDGRTIGDSTAIIAALEERFPQSPLYPADPEQRRRALALEEFFDEELGPYARQLFFYELINEPAMFSEVASAAVPGPLGNAKTFVGAYARFYTSLRFRANSKTGAVTARAKILAALDRLDAELETGDGEFLVGNSFSVADLTAASLFYPVVAPAEGPTPPDLPQPPAYQAFRDEISDRPGYRWVEETFRRHRHRTPAQPAAASATL